MKLIRKSSFDFFNNFFFYAVECFGMHCELSCSLLSQSSHVPVKKKKNQEPGMNIAAQNPISHISQAKEGYILKLKKVFYIRASIKTVVV